MLAGPGGSPPCPNPAQRDGRHQMKAAAGSMDPGSGLL
ncbi:MAG: hypothetical protein AVDCRST_MAG83-3177 [uncultured Arthrobacter sp.]|uniref:Uncharacterized protein n=1 Tax=uncultured Arthrobacter sp. TaxID=114050 RepID=A0A6J4J1G0_9MICC|nr:MAG: hypothetical protein AVDCRST_MAG83-3177 [uncultured Arthrobacter sp.]